MTLLSKPMTKSLTELVSCFEQLWPIDKAEPWDKPGLTVGNLAQSVSKVLLGVDVTTEVIAEAKSLGCELIVSHHPVLLKGVNHLGEDQLKGELVTMAIRNSIALYSAHTNADIVTDGVSDTLARAIGLANSVPLVPVGESSGHGRIGELAKPVTLADLAERIHNLLPATSAPVRVAGSLESLVRVVAVVGGAGDSFIPTAQQLDADVLVTSDLRHHVSLDAISDPSKPLSLIDISHFAAESLWLAPAAQRLGELNPGLEFVVSKVLTDPWTLTIPGMSNREG